MGRKKARASGVERTDGSDISYIRFIRDIVEIDVQSGDVDERVLGALLWVRDTLGSSTPEVTRYLRLGEALDAARKTPGASGPSRTLEYLAAKSFALRDLIEGMRLAEAVQDDLGIQAIASLLAAPQRTIRFEESVSLLGLFAPTGQLERAHGLVIRWRFVSGSGYRDVAFEGVDEAGPAGQDVERLLVNVAYDARVKPRKASSRAAVLVGLETLAALGDVDQFQRQLIALGAVHDATVEANVVSDLRNLTGVDRALAERGYDLLFVLAQAQEQWAFRRAADFRKRGGKVQVIYPAASAEVLSKIGDFLRDLASSLGQVESAFDEIESGSSHEQQNAIRAGLKAQGMKIVFVGGDQTQEQYRGTIESDLEKIFGAGITIRWFGGWGSSWDSTADAAERELGGADALVLMSYVRTELGRTLRRAAGDHGVPWIKCGGSGRASIQRSIEGALSVILRKRA